MSHSARFWSRLGLGSPEGDPEETRAFLQKRITFLIGIVGLLWLAITVSATVSAAIFLPSLLAGPGASRAALVHNLGTLGLLLCWLVCRRLRLSLRALNWLDAGVTVAQAVVRGHGGGRPARSPARLRPAPEPAERRSRPTGLWRVATPAPGPRSGPAVCGGRRPARR